MLLCPRYLLHYCAPAGANLANGWMLRPGASVIELIPYQFDTGRGAMVFSSMNAKVRLRLPAQASGEPMLCRNLAGVLAVGLHTARSRRTGWPLAWAALHRCLQHAAGHHTPVLPAQSTAARQRSPALQDATSQVLWWVGILCDPSASTPGPDEHAGTGLPEWWPRDRSSRVPWAALEAALADVVAAGGSQQRYLEHYAANRHRFYFGGGGVLGHGARCPNATAGGGNRRLASA